jgi:hypothetical protein
MTEFAVALRDKVIAGGFEVVESDESWEASTAIVAVNPDQQESLAIHTQIDAITDKITQHEAWLQIGWIQLGMLVHRVREKKYWSDYGYQNFPSFVENVAVRVDRKRSYIYLCKGIAEKLLPQLLPETLIEMGITKAEQLTKLAAGGGTIPPSVVQKALTAKTAEVKAVVQTILHPLTPLDEGKWFDFGGFYLTDEEKVLFQLAYDLALQDADQPIGTEHVEHVEKKLVVMRWCAEYWSTYGGLNEHRAA